MKTTEMKEMGKKVTEAIMAGGYGKQTARRITKIIVHCTATKAGREVSVAEVDGWHRARGFKCIGYHWLVGVDGTVYAGRPESMVGAHCKGLNGCSIGVVYVGGLGADGKPADTRTAQQREALKWLIGCLRDRYAGAKVHGHREFAAKACPCFDAAAEYNDAPAGVDAGVRAGRRAPPRLRGCGRDAAACLKQISPPAQAVGACADGEIRAVMSESD